MHDLEIKFKALTENAKPPYKAHATDIGYDLFATSVIRQERHGQVFYVIGCGLAFEIPEGYGGFLLPRSSVANTPLILSNCVGVIDPDYRGEVKAKFRIDASANHYAKDEIYKIGDRFAQLVILKTESPAFIQVGELSNTQRGEGGYGSTGIR